MARNSNASEDSMGWPIEYRGCTRNPEGNQYKEEAGKVEPLKIPI